MNLLCENAPDFLTVGGEKLKINTDFFVWIRFLTAFETNDVLRLENSLVEIFGKIPDTSSFDEIISAMRDWLNLTDEKAFKTGQACVPCLSFCYDGNLIYAELWKYFPDMMKRGLTYQEGIELVNLILCDDKTMLWHRAFARSGDFSQFPKEQKRYWEKERAKYKLPSKANQQNTDDVLSSVF